MKNSFLKNLTFKFIVISLLGVLSHAYAGEMRLSTITDALINNNQENTFLTSEQAFKLDLSAKNYQSIEARFKVASGYYLYKDRIRFVLTPDSAAKIVNTELPKAELKEDQNFGKMEVYHHDFNAKINLNNIKSGAIKIVATFQGCSEKGLCYAPITKNFTVDLVAIKSTANSAKTLADNNTGNHENELENTTKALASGNAWLVIAVFFVAGVLLSLTPCVLPMIPILSSIIVGSQSQKAKPSKVHTFGLSLAYVLGMALSYTLAGVAAGLSGSLLSQSLQNAWVLGASALIFVLLACSMFGFYELKLPQKLQDKILKISHNFKGGDFFGVFFMGSLSALIVSPCVAAPLAGALIYIGQTHHLFLGGLALFSLAIGMGVPLLLIGASAGSVLPKAGRWMHTVRNFFGILMLGMAIWLISPIISISAQMILWAALLIVTAVYHQALERLATHSTNLDKVYKGIAVFLFILGTIFLIGALSGAQSLWQPLSHLKIAQSEQSKTLKTLAFTRITSVADLEKKLNENQGKPVMLDFYAEWCVACKELEQFTFSDAKIQQLLKNTLLLQADVTANSEEDKALLKRFGLYGPPAIIFFNREGKEISSLKTIGFQDAPRFSLTLAKRDRCIVASENKLTPC